VYAHTHTHTHIFVLLLIPCFPLTAKNEGAKCVPAAKNKKDQPDGSGPSGAVQRNATHARELYVLRLLNEIHVTVPLN
jgi:hypothetical protein